MMRLLQLVLTLAVLLAPAPLLAQGATPVAAPSDTAIARPRVTPTPASLAVADTLMRELGLERVIRAGAMVTFDASVQQQPGMAPFRDVVEAWVTKYLSWEEIGAAMSMLYAETFTERELRMLVEFYRTPVGRRLALVTPELSQRGAAIGAAIGEKHSPELQRMMQARAAELQATGTPPE